MRRPQPPFLPVPTFGCFGWRWPRAGDRELNDHLGSGEAGLDWGFPRPPGYATVNAMPMSASPLKIHAGVEALAHLREHGLRADDISMMLAASGGPKWLVLGPLDRYLMREWFARRERPLHLLGTSAGAWRMACYAQTDPLAAHLRFQEAYTAQSYEKHPRPQDVSDACRRILDEVLANGAENEILHHPVIRYHVLVARCRGIVGLDQWALQSLGLFVAALGNLAAPGAMYPWVDRVLFHHPDPPPIDRFPHLPVRRVPLNEENLGKAMLATGAIPLVIAGVRKIPGAPAGTYRDGGLTDYQFDLPALPGEGFVLYPHYSPRPPVPGWLDKRLWWRRPSREHYRRTILVTPSAEFVARLPDGILPDRNDFYLFTYAERRRRWEQVLAASERLRDALDDIHTRQRWGELAEPLPW